jgi:hypothetical protein
VFLFLKDGEVTKKHTSEKAQTVKIRVRVSLDAKPLFPAANL